MLLRIENCYGKQMILQDLIDYQNIADLIPNMLDANTGFVPNDILVRMPDGSEIIFSQHDMHKEIGTKMNRIMKLPSYLLTVGNDKMIITADYLKNSVVFVIGN